MALAESLRRGLRLPDLVKACLFLESGGFGCWHLRAARCCAASVRCTVGLSPSLLRAEAQSQVAVRSSRQPLAAVLERFPKGKIETPHPGIEVGVAAISIRGWRPRVEHIVDPEREPPTTEDFAPNQFTQV